ncbi:hypothetical protein IFM89_039215 [Coptis chinensis]|uniref:Ubiquitin-like domain-containing protein n=1 Tax=Coptis chinensis TaxID=261450 RepID=A0A835HHW8_9MAGN|nr:hypothetical protein IFM89_039215 [Coptis chinensis]
MKLFNDHVDKKKRLVERFEEGHVFKYSVDEEKYAMELVNNRVDEEETTAAEPAENKIMKINMRVMKTIPLEVMEYDTIRKVKAKFSETEGVSMMNLKKLFFGANSLDSDNKLVDYGIKEGSTLNLFLHSGAKIQIEVKLSHYSKTINGYDGHHS